LEQNKPSDAFNHFSQFGEDGIIQTIFQIIGTESKICIEFGASDGLFCSNTAYLWGFQNWKAILIEADQNKFNELKKNIGNFNCTPICKYIDCEENSVDNILKNLKITKTVDLISIDIDGDDYHIFKNMKISPRVVICEYNPTLPPTFDIYQEYHNQENIGCSAAALVRIALEKDYFLVAITETNCIFVQKKYREKFSRFELDFQKLITDDLVKYIATSYSGKTRNFRQKKICTLLYQNSWI